MFAGHILCIESTGPSGFGGDMYCVLKRKGFLKRGSLRYLCGADARHVFDPRTRLRRGKCCGPPLTAIRPYTLRRNSCCRDGLRYFNAMGHGPYLPIRRMAILYLQRRRVSSAVSSNARPLLIAVTSFGAISGKCTISETRGNSWNAATQ
jgi:hypothetical protein